MHGLSFIRKVASILLVVCFVLPLSKCTTKMGADRNTTSTDYFYEYEMAVQGWTEVKQGKTLNGLAVLLAVFNAFFLPFSSLKLNEKYQVLIHFLGSFSAAYILFFWVFVFSEGPQIGGLFTIGCWGVLFFSSVLGLIGYGHRT